MVTWNDVVEFIQRISIGHPGFALLIGIEQVSCGIKCKLVGDANARRYRGPMPAPWIELLDGSTGRVQVVERNFLFRGTIDRSILLDQPCFFLLS